MSLPDLPISVSRADRSLASVAGFAPQRRRLEFSRVELDGYSHLVISGDRAA
jgi:hypothetical protein